MKKILQHLNNGRVIIEQVPRPVVSDNEVLIRSAFSVISSGTEKMLLDFGNANIFGKALQQPDKVKEVLGKIQSDGVLATLEAVRGKLSVPIELGYSNVGYVEEIGSQVTGFAVGDRVASNGSHAEYIAVPVNLCARVPDSVATEEAAFTVLAAIGLQGVRLAEPTLGECIVVTGLGLIGLLTVQILRSHGCRVLGLDFDADRLEVARSLGAETVNLGEGQNPLAAAQRLSRGRGVDAVIITASSKSNEPVSHAAQMCRKRGRIVLVGVAGLELSRADFYEKELSFQVSCSYGPGRYDKAYEEEGRDYPVGFVRWTEQRNFEAVLDLMAAGQLNVTPLISHISPISAAVDAYDRLVSNKGDLAILLDYSGGQTSTDTTGAAPEQRRVRKREELEPVVGVIGAGNYSGRMLLPVMHRAGADVRALVSSGGVSAAYHGKKFGIATVDSDPLVVFDDPEVTTVVIATRHDSHADYVLRAIDAGKHVFVEKPLCLTLDELNTIEAALADSDRLLMVGFNRRFAPLVVKMRELLATTAGRKSIIMTVNAGVIPADHWTRDRDVGGGRIIGEACHFIDLLRFIAGHSIVESSITSVDAAVAADPIAESAMISLKFADGSIGAIQYVTNGSNRYPKERVEVFVDSKVLRLDNFRRLDGWGWNRFSKRRSWRMDKGQKACIETLFQAIRSGGAAPIPLEEVLEVSRASIELGRAAR